MDASGAPTLELRHAPRFGGAQVRRAGQEAELDAGRNQGQNGQRLRSRIHGCDGHARPRCDRVADRRQLRRPRVGDFGERRQRQDRGPERDVAGCVLRRSHRCGSGRARGDDTGTYSGDARDERRTKGYVHVVPCNSAIS